MACGRGGGGGQIALTSLTSLTISCTRHIESRAKIYFWPVGGWGQIPLTSLTSLTISPAVLKLNIGEQHINKALANVNGIYIRPGGVLNTSYNSYNRTKL